MISAPVAKANPTSGKALLADEIFGMMASFVNRGEGKDLIKKVDAVFNFEIKETKKGPVVKSFVIDLKNGQGKVYAGNEKTANSTFTMVDGDFEKVCMGTLNPQNAFIQGKMKIKGNMKKATLFTPELFPKPTPENKAKYTSAKLWNFIKL